MAVHIQTLKLRNLHIRCHFDAPSRVNDFLIPKTVKMAKKIQEKSRFLLPYVTNLLCNEQEHVPGHVLRWGSTTPY